MNKKLTGFLYFNVIFLIIGFLMRNTINHWGYFIALIIIGNLLGFLPELTFKHKSQKFKTSLLYIVVFIIFSILFLLSTNNLFDPVYWFGILTGGIGGFIGLIIQRKRSAQ